MNAPGLNERQIQKMKTQPGFVAALDQSGGSTPKALAAYGIKEGSWSNENEMFEIVHQMRAHHHQSQLHRRSDSWRDYLRGHNGQGNRGTARGGLSLEREIGRPLPESGQGSG